MIIAKTPFTSVGVLLIALEMMIPRKDSRALTTFTATFLVTMGLVGLVASWLLFVCNSVHW